MGKESEVVRFKMRTSGSRKLYRVGHGDCNQKEILKVLFEEKRPVEILRNGMDWKLQKYRWLIFFEIIQKMDEEECFEMLRKYFSES